MATFLLASMKRKDSEVISEHHSDLALLSHSKKIKLSLDGELPLIIDEEATMISEGFEAHVPKEQEFILYNKSVKQLPSSDNLDMMTAAEEEMITENESAAARTAIFHTREENEWRNEPMEEEDEEKAMEVEDGTGDGGLEKQQEERMAEEAQPIGVPAVDMIWSGFF